MTFDYEQVCKLLTETVPLTNSPTFEINPNGKCDEQFFEKICSRYEYCPKSKKGNPKKQDLSCVGSCDIDNLNGNEILRLFFNICENKSLGHADFLCFSANGKTCAAIYANYSNFLIVTETPPEGSKFRSVFTLLFDNSRFQSNKRKSYESYPTDENVQFLRQKAKVEFPKFLKTTFSQFDLHPFGVAFLGLAFDIAKQSSSEFFLKHFHPEVKNIPFAACIKLAFDYDQTGKVTELFGEISHVERHVLPKKIAHEKKATLSCTTARDMLNNIADENGEFQNNKVLEVVQEIKQIFQIDDDEITSET